MNEGVGNFNKSLAGFLATAGGAGTPFGYGVGFEYASLPRVQLPHLRCLCRPPTRPSWAKSTAKQPNCRPRGSLLSAADMHETHRPCERCPAASTAASSTAPAAKTRAQRGS